jgi:O-methyltransferase
MKAPHETPLRLLGDQLEKNTNSMIISYDDPERAEVIANIKRIKNEVRLLLHNNEAYQVYMAVKNTMKIEGDIAEVGSFQGGSAKLIALAKGTRPFHVFDTFEGLPEPTPEDGNTVLYKNQMTSIYDDVSNYLKAFPSVHIYKGLFPVTSGPIQGKKFSFVHLDVDLYKGTKDSLEFFYPRMSRGAILMCHDYIYQQGVRKAVDGFFANKSEPVIEMSGNQALVVKI